MLRFADGNGLLGAELVGTRILQGTVPGLEAYPLLLEHERVPFITYPHEWTVSMFRDAVMFHIDLMLRLDAWGWTLKDCHLFNVLFRGARPVFVDVLSLIPADRIADEEWLVPKARGARSGARKAIARAHLELYRRMFRGQMLLPLYAMERRRYRRVREQMLATTLNAGPGRLRARAVLECSPSAWGRYLAWEVVRHAALWMPGGGPRAFWTMQRREVAGISVVPRDSGYKDYYRNKGEDDGLRPAPDWSPKKRVVYEVLERSGPATVLDLGSNTGWYSRLAASLGADVVAVDEDESSIDALYLRTRTDGSSIVPLAIDVLHPTPEVAASEEALAERAERTTVAPLLVSAHDRLRCDVVLVLALLHHLVLGRGASLNAILDALTRLTSRVLVLEFVSMEDPQIQMQPDFFAVWSKDPAAARDYSRENVIRGLEQRSMCVEVLPSDAPSRWLLIATRAAR